ncbi:MAG: hypothetical protein ACOCTG_06145 [Bacteroidota bacterium]
MSNIGYNILILAFCWVVATGAGVYMTFVKQPQDLDRVQKAEQVIRMKEAELTALLAEKGESEALAEAAVRKWNGRYRSIPKTLTSPEVIAYLNDLTPAGFENFDVSYDRTTTLADYSYHTFKVTGRGYFNSLYRFVWDIENSRSFYRLRDLSLDHIDLIKRDRETTREQMQVMVSFSANIEAYFGGIEGMSAEDEQYARRNDAESGLLSDAPIAAVPEDILPRKRPAINPFFPVIMENLPPNTDNLVELDNATLVSIADNRAVFQFDGEFRALAVGDPIYLGHVTSIDPVEGQLTARLNKGGIIDDAVVYLDSGDRLRHLRGLGRLTPIE